MPCGNSLLSISSTRWVQLQAGKVALQSHGLQWRRHQYFYSQVSDTYPADLFVPKSATPPVIVGSSKFRSRGRFPALSYYSKENQVCWWHFSSLSQRYIVSNFLPILSKLFILISKGFSNANQISFLDLNPYLIKIHLWIHCRPDLTSHI